MRNPERICHFAIYDLNSTRAACGCSVRQLAMDRIDIVRQNVSCLDCLNALDAADRDQEEQPQPRERETY